MTTEAPPLQARATEWRLTLPARTPYDRELLAQCIRSAVARGGSVQVEVGLARWIVDAVPATAPPCRHCRRAAHGVQWRREDTLLCLRCGLAAATDAEATATAGGCAATLRGRSGRHSARHSDCG